MNDTPKIEWKRGSDFAEIAEALAIRTPQIMGAQVGKGRAIVVYTPELDEAELDPETPLYVARLERDADRILVRVGEPRLMEMNWADLEASIEQAIGDYERS